MHQLIHSRIDNPEVSSRAIAIAAFAIGGAVQGGIVGSVFTEQRWYDGLWKGALAGAVAGGALAGLVALIDRDAKFTYGDQDRCDITWGEIGRNTLSTILPAALIGAVAGAVVAPKGDRLRISQSATLWSAVIWGLSTAALDYTRKIAPPAECR